MSRSALESLDFVRAEEPAGYLSEVIRADSAVADLSDYDAVGLGHGRPLGHTLIKMVHEYTLHSGQAHMLRFAALGDMRR